MRIPAIERLGGRAAVAAHLAGRGAKISPRGVRGWESRGSVPGYAIIALTKWARERGLSLDATDFEARPAISKPMKEAS